MASKAILVVSKVEIVGKATEGTIVSIHGARKPWAIVAKDGGRHPLDGLAFRTWGEADAALRTFNGQA